MQLKILLHGPLQVRLVDVLAVEISFNYRINAAGNAIASLRLSVRQFVFTVDFEHLHMSIGYDHSSQEIEGQGHRSRLRPWVRLIRSVRPRLGVVFKSFFRIL